MGTPFAITLQVDPEVAATGEQVRFHGTATFLAFGVFGFRVDVSSNNTVFSTLTDPFGRWELKAAFEEPGTYPLNAVLSPCLPPMTLAKAQSIVTVRPSEMQADLVSFKVVRIP